MGETDSNPIDRMISGSAKGSGAGGRIVAAALLAALGAFALWLGIGAARALVAGAGGAPHEVLALPVAAVLFVAAWGALRGRRMAAVNDPWVAAALSYAFGALLLLEAAWLRRTPGADWVAPAAGGALFLALGAWKSRRRPGAAKG